MKISVLIAVGLAVVAGSHTLSAQTSNPVDLLAAQDIRLAQVSDRLLAANDPLCRLHMPLAGFLVHTRDQYRTDTGRAFINGPVAIAQVLPNSPAFGVLKPGDGVVSIGGKGTDGIKAEGTAPQRDAVFEVLAAEPLGQPLTLTIRRDGTQQSVTIQPRTGCRALVEIRSVEGHNARSDGRVIQVDYGLAAAASESELAAVFAHEFAHLVLEHRRRLTAAGVSKGFFGEFGKNQRLNRQIEVEADRLSVHLLANAGYDPRVAPAFWRSPLGRQAGGLLLVSSTYPSPEARAQGLEREIADYLRAGTAPSWPGHLLARRDVPFN
ncbi:MAG: M48 family metalloprotease [Croceibacterium sp.]